MGKLQVVVGGQFGSEAKGAVTARLCRQEAARGVDVFNLRVGGPNAGHTVYDDAGREWKLRQYPVGCVIPRVRVGIAAGSEVDLSVLIQEQLELLGAGHQYQGLMVDNETTLLASDHIKAEKDAEITARLGSTAKGIGAARADRLWRTAKRWVDLRDDGTDTAAEARRVMQNGGTVIIEGTQGFGLGLHAGHYPYCTSGDARAIDFLAQAGISPWADYVDEFEVWVVFRTRPIRVAGNSGSLAGETSWRDLGLPEERTTVTNKVRRVGEWDPELAKAAIQANGGPGSSALRVALTMADQVIPAIKGWTEVGADIQAVADLHALIIKTELDLGVPVSLVGTSPTTMIERRRLVVRQGASA